MLPVDRLAVGRSRLLELRRVNPAVLPGDLLGHGHGQVKGVLHGADELRRLVQGLRGADFQPRVAAPERHHREQAVLKVHPVEVGDLQLAAGRGLDQGEAEGHVALVEVQAGDCVGALRELGLLLDRDGTPLPIELHDTEALGVVHVLAEDRGATGLGHLDGARQVAGEAVSVNGAEMPTQ